MCRAINLKVVGALPMEGTRTDPATSRENDSLQAEAATAPATILKTRAATAQRKAGNYYTHTHTHTHGHPHPAA